MATDTLTVKEAARVMGVKVRWIYALIYAGRLRAVPLQDRHGGRGAAQVGDQ